VLWMTTMPSFAFYDDAPLARGWQEDAVTLSIPAHHRAGVEYGHRSFLE
jgi:hypothetical protein